MKTQRIKSRFLYSLVLFALLANFCAGASNYTAESPPEVNDCNEQNDVVIFFDYTIGGCYTGLKSKVYEDNSYIGSDNSFNQSSRQKHAYKSDNLAVTGYEKIHPRANRPNYISFASYNRPEATKYNNSSQNAFACNVNYSSNLDYTEELTPPSTMPQILDTSVGKVMEMEPVSAEDSDSITEIDMDQEGPYVQQVTLHLEDNPLQLLPSEGLFLEVDDGFGGSFSIAIFGQSSAYQASNPDPANDVNCVATDLEKLDWDAGSNNFKHYIHFDTNEYNVNNDPYTSGDSYRGWTWAATSEWDIVEDLGHDLDRNTVYYWRIDEYYRIWHPPVGCASGYYTYHWAKGNVWNFTTAKIWYVNNAVFGGNDNGISWADAFDDLQSALDVANPNDHIWVADGNGPYFPSNQTDPCDPNSATFQLVSGVAIYGGFAGTEDSLSERDWTENVTILSGDIGVEDDVNDNCYHVVTGTGNATLDGFTITDGFAWGSDANGNGGGIYNYQVSPTIANCIFSDNSALYYGGGVYNWSAPQKLIQFK